MATQTGKLLIIFYRNQKIGAVKTRLAATIGDEKALRIYGELCEHTRAITETLPVTKVVFYSNEVKTGDVWPDNAYQKALQKGQDLGERMHNAFATGFASGYDSICIIGTDCYGLTASVIEDAFNVLRATDAVIGPAEDGGYYLLGLRKLHPELFVKKNWSTSSVFKDTLENFESRGITYGMLPLLRDVDVEDDLPAELRKML